jgi:Heavy metal associated domain 2
MEQCRKSAGRPGPDRLVVRLRSRVPGRMRWAAEALRDRPRKAAAVAMALRQMAGIHSAESTPLTGRLLVRYASDLSPQQIAAMVHTALRPPSLSPEAYAALNGASIGQRSAPPGAQSCAVRRFAHALTLTNIPPAGVLTPDLRRQIAPKRLAGPVAPTHTSLARPKPLARSRMHRRPGNTAGPAIPFPLTWRARPERCVADHPRVAATRLVGKRL